MDSRHFPCYRLNDECPGPHLMAGLSSYSPCEATGVGSWWEPGVEKDEVKGWMHWVMTSLLRRHCTFWRFADILCWSVPMMTLTIWPLLDSAPTFMSLGGQWAWRVALLWRMAGKRTSRRYPSWRTWTGADPIPQPHPMLRWVVQNSL